jgi:predicted hotdog family 3-hydroxylacyl-ACP dehydratase
MLDRSGIAALIPHQGAMCLLDRVAAWTDADIVCHAVSHLDPTNPLRRQGRLSTVCGIEYALQAAAVHGALRGGAPQPPGRLVALRNVIIHRPRLDEAGGGRLRIEAEREHAGPAGLIYRFRLRAEDGGPLAEGRATIALPPERTEHHGRDP